MKIGNWTKLITLLVVDLGIILLMFFKTVEGSVGIPILAASLGYVFGNGQAIAENRKK